MKQSRTCVAVALLLAATASMTACGAGSGSAGSTEPQAVSTVNGAGKTVTVWVMTDDYTTETLDAINTEFTKQTGAKVDVQVQAWDGITTKITTALATSTPPDVLDLGNTQVASFAATGGLKDLTPYAADLKQGQTWVAGLADPATVDGNLYAVPGFAGARAVIYNKTMWAKAGITSAPTTFAELTADLDKVRAANPAPDFSPFYLPGQSWYAGMQFVWDAGGDIATRSGSTWTAGLGSPASQTGLAAYKSFQNTYSVPASRTVDNVSPDQTQIFADGKASAMLDTNGKIAMIKKANPKITDADLGTFPMPGSSGKTQPVMIGGSDWGIAAKSANADLALQWVKIAASPEVQKTWVAGHDGWIPNSTEAIKAADSTLPPLQKAFFGAALNSKATPASANWARVEGNKDINTLFSAIASGTKTPQDAAGAFDAAVGKALNAAQ
ncbi:N,N'-diacetylchitobiose transport system substrate-binding protein [Micromonospora jinlongensis]|uniref:N,N'-diacetylchitobiose transport system substrate-binding protein n=1 Tax=Micromonospora jinlongensis TaxID=1287877 RepID=A0A7Y9X008_9ACTN|nr:sugar ABC transporter substrate-binding protein [Micromonospora jinlongensis]NYH41947.1 N,N'-diacetylchitobiose transport system substrate-binding protein [Micromonospora jinlongensis]